MFTAPLALALALQLQSGASRTVLATILDPMGQPTIDVGPDDFVVRESGKPREVLTVRIADYPVIVLLDNGDEGQSDFEALRTAAARFVTRLGPRPVAIGTLADPPALVASFDDERAVAVERLEGLTPVASTGGVLLQSVANAAEVIRRSESPFGAIVVLSSSAIDRTTAPRKDLLRRIADSHAMVSVIARRESGRPPSAELLRDLVDETRAQLTTVYSSASYQIALDRLVDRMATEMMIEYLVPPKTPATRDVKVGLTIPGARVTGFAVR